MIENENVVLVCQKPVSEKLSIFDALLYLNEFGCGVYDVDTELLDRGEADVVFVMHNKAQIFCGTSVQVCLFMNLLAEQY